MDSPVGALFRTLFTLIAGAGLAAGGFVAATMAPELREQLAGGNLTAATEESSAFEGEFGSFAGNDFSFDSGPASKEDFLTTGPTSTTDFGNHFNDSGFGQSVPANRPTSLDNPQQQPQGPQRQPQGLEWPPRETAGTPRAGLFPENTDWSTAVAKLNAVGIHDYTIQTTDSAGQLRCDCWIADGSVRRQLSGFGSSPGDAAASLCQRVQEFRQQSNWFANQPASVDQPPANMQSNNVKSNRDQFDAPPVWAQ